MNVRKMREFLVWSMMLLAVAGSVVVLLVALTGCYENGETKAEVIFIPQGWSISDAELRTIQNFERFRDRATKHNGGFLLPPEDVDSYPKGESYHFGLGNDQQKPNGLREEVPKDTRRIRA